MQANPVPLKLYLVVKLTRTEEVCAVVTRRSVLGPIRLQTSIIEGELFHLPASTRWSAAAPMRIAGSRMTSVG